MPSLQRNASLLLGGSSQLASGIPKYNWTNPTQPIYNQGHNPALKNPEQQPLGVQFSHEQKKTQKKIFLGSLGGGPRQDSLKIAFSFQGFFGFGHFQPSAVFCTLAVRCLHGFKLAGTNRLTTAAMNILGLKIKTVCSNFEMFGHILDNNLSFMLYFLKNMLHKLVAHFAEVVRPLEFAVDSC